MRHSVEVASMNYAEVFDADGEERHCNQDQRIEVQEEYCQQCSLWWVPIDLVKWRVIPSVYMHGSRCFRLAVICHP